jgi:MoxR-like ATPase
MNLVLKALDPVDGKNYYITNILQDKTYVIPQENIIWGATVNLGGKYTGTNALDEALFDRFNIVSFVGYNPDVEKAIVHAAGFDADHSKKILDFVSKVRDFAKSGELRSPISTRGIKVWMEDFLNSSDLMLSFERTLLFRLVTVDEFGSPNDKELAIVKKQFQTILK